MKTDSLKKSTIKRVTWISIIIISIITILCFYMAYRGESIINASIDRYLEEISKQSAYNVSQRVESNLEALKSYRDALYYIDEQNYAAFSKKATTGSAFEWIGIVSYQGDKFVDETGSYTFQDDVISQAIQGNNSISKDLVYDETSKKKGILYAIPFEKDHEKKAIVGWITTDIMKLLLNTDSFEGYGFSHVVSTNGDFILHSKNKNALILTDNYFRYFDNDPNAVPYSSISKMEKNFKDHKDGIFNYKINGEERTMLYTYMPETDWYLMTIVVNNTYASEINTYVKATIITVAAITVFLLLMILIVAINHLSKKKNEEIKKLAFVDPVTNGYTAARFEIELNHFMEHTPFEPFTFVCLDIKNFKLVNDFYGNEDGNKVLAYIYQCIQHNLGENEYVSRISADNFNIIFQCTQKNEINERLKEIAQHINAFNFDNKTPYFLSTICGSYIVEHKENIFTLRDRANMARKNNVVNNQRLCSNTFYTDSERMAIIKEKEMENAMEKALENHEFVVYLQPKVNLKNGHIQGGEALVRWKHPTKGMIYPNDFIPLFEKNDFIIKLDLYVFEETCRILHRWIKQGLTPIRISVNLSRSHLRYKDFLKDYQAIQQKYDIPANLLEIELTETIVFENLSMLKHVINEIHQLGFQCSMDDFGSGYSSLNVLKEVSVDSLKLDRIFFDEDASSEKGKEIIRSVIQLAENLHMETVAEGIETMPQVDMLKQMNCDMVQGYVFEKPIPVEQFEELLKEDLQFIHPTK